MVEKKNTMVTGRVLTAPANLKAQASKSRSASVQHASPPGGPDGPFGPFTAFAAALRLLMGR